MNSKQIRFAAFALFGLMLIPGGEAVCKAQTANGPSASVFQQLFPAPTGENGYEELVQAGELAHSSARFAAALQPGVSLKTLRDALADPPTAQALRMLRTGIAKPILAMRHKMDEETTFPELQLLRDLGRLLKIEQYVLLADGRNAAAIDSMRDALKLAQVVQSNFLLSGLTGITIDSIAVDSIARHLEVFSIPDCNRLLQMLDAWLAQPSPLARLLQGERDFDITILRKKRTDSAAMLSLLKNMLHSAQSPPISSSVEVDHLTNLVQTVEANLDGITPIVDKATETVNDLYQQAFRTLREPTWTWKDVKVSNVTGPAGQLASSVFPPLGSFMEKYILDRTKIQLLAVHAAIHRFQWDSLRLPKSLEELKIGDRIIDPFTGAPMIYTRTSEDSYELSSAGGLDRGTGETPPTGTRVPVSLMSKAKL